MKKFLSLVLSLAMTLSLVTISASATDYKNLSDKGEIKYEEAVAVLNKLGIITGYEDGSFKPTGSLTRGAAAKIIVSLMIGPEAATALTVTGAPYKDVPVTNTFAAVISYCKTAGYINGYTDGTFRPTAALSGFAFTKMLLGAVGYRGDIEHFTGSGWTMNVAKLGKQSGLFDDFSTAFVGGTNVDRESACLLALNTLKATEVEYTANGNNLNVNDKGNIVGASTNYTRSYVTSRNDNINKNISKEKSGNDSSYYTLEFGEEHFQDLKLTADGNATDDYGRPSNQWSYKNVKVGTYAKSADYSYTTSASGDTASDKVKDMGLKDFKVAPTSYTENGLSVTFSNTSNTEAGEKARMEQVADKLTANGTLVQLYLDEDNADTITHVVVIKTQMMQVNAVKSNAVSLKKLDDNQQDKEGVLNSDNTRSASSVSFKTIDDVKDDDTAYATLKDLKADDYVLIVPLTTDSGKSYTADKVAVPQSVSGKLTQIATKSSNHKVKAITVAGTAYTMSAQWTSEDNNLQVTTKLSSNTDTTVYLDTYGYAIYVKDVIDSNSSIVIDEIYSSVVNGRIVNSAKGWDSKGNELSLNLGSSPSFKGGSALPSNAAIQGKVYEYETYTGNDADYRLIPNATTYAAGSLVYAMANQQVINGQVSAKIDATNFKNFASDVKFIFESVDEDGDVTGITVHDGVTEVHKNDPTTLYYILNKAGDKIVAVVVPDDDDAANTANLLYVQKVTGYKQNADGDTVAVFTAYIDGKEVTGCEYTKKDLPAGGDAFYTYSKNETTGVYTLSKYSESLKTTKATAVVSNYELNGTVITGDDYFTGKYALKDSSIKTLNAKNAQVVDLYTDDGVAYTSLKDMREAISLNKVGSFKVSYVYNGSDTTGAGTVAYIFITNNSSTSTSNPIDQTGNTPKNATVTFNDVTVASNGKLNMSVSYTAPGYAADTAKLKFAVEVYVDGKYYDTIRNNDAGWVYAPDGTSASSVMTNGKFTSRYTSNINFVPTTGAITFKVVDETFSNVETRFIDGDTGNTLTRVTVPTASQTVTTGATQAINFTVGTSDAGTTLQYAVSGVVVPTGVTLDKHTVEAANNVQQTVTNSAGTATAAWAAKGDSYVTITVYGLKALAATEKFDITSNVSALALTPTNFSGGVADETTTLTVTGTALDSISSGTNAIVTMAASAATFAKAYNYAVTLKINGQTITHDLNGVSEVSFLVANVTSNLEINKADITLVATPNLAITSASATTTTMTFTFNAEVDADTVAATDFTPTVASGATIGDVNVSGNTVTLTFVGGALAKGDKVETVTKGVNSKADASNQNVAVQTITLGDNLVTTIV